MGQATPRRYAPPLSRGELWHITLPTTYGGPPLRSATVGGWRGILVLCFFTAPPPPPVAKAMGGPPPLASPTKFCNFAGPDWGGI